MWALAPVPKTAAEVPKGFTFSFLGYKPALKHPQRPQQEPGFGIYLKLVDCEGQGLGRDSAAALGEKGRGSPFSTQLAQELGLPEVLQIPPPLSDSYSKSSSIMIYAQAL